MKTARTATHGPWRRVTEVRDICPPGPPGAVNRYEMLECGHRGRNLRHDRPAVKRRCGACLPAWRAERALAEAMARQRAAEAERRRLAPLTAQERGEPSEAEVLARRAAMRLVDLGLAVDSSRVC